MKAPPRLGMLVIALILSASVPALRAEVRWLARGNLSATRVDSDKIVWIQLQQNAATGSMSDGYLFETNNRDDVRWLKQMTDVEAEWVKVDAAPPAAGTERYWRWADIRLVTRSSRGVEVWSSGRPSTEPGNISVTNANDVKRILRMAGID